MSILVVGSVALDSIETPYGKVKDILGGSATYFSICANFFTKVNIVAVVGRDFPKRYIRLLESRNIGLDGLEIKDAKTFRWRGLYNSDLDTAHTLSTHLNVFSEFNPNIPLSYRNTSDLFLANIDPVLQYNVLTQIKSPRFVACDSMNYWIEKKKGSLIRLFKKIDLVFLNEAEAKNFSGEYNLIKAARFIISKGPDFVIIKRAQAGAVLFGRDFIYCAPAYLCKKVIDPTGAGDSFAGGFMGYISRCSIIDRQQLCKAVRYATIMASFAIEDFSVNRLANLQKSEIKRRVEEYIKMTTR